MVNTILGEDLLKWKHQVRIEDYLTLVKKEDESEKFGCWFDREIWSDDEEILKAASRSSFDPSKIRENFFLRSAFFFFTRSIMATKGNPGDNKTRSSISIFIVFGLCCFFYLLGAWQRSGFGKGDSIAHEITKNADCSILSNLNVETHHGDGRSTDFYKSEVKVFQPCDDRFIDYTPCQDQMRAMTFPRENMNYRERHCPPEDEKLHCLIPAPKGYVSPFPWPKSRDYVPFVNAPYKSLTVEKAVQNWIQYEGDVFRFPGGGTHIAIGGTKGGRI